MTIALTLNGGTPQEPKAPEVNVEPNGNGGVNVIPPDPNGTPAGDAPKPDDRPKWLPEKFKSAEDLANAYSELEKKLGEPKPQDQGQAPAVVDLDALTSEFTEKGSLTEETYASLEKAGISRKTVDSFIAGQQALAASRESALAAEVGGAEQLQSILQWANANLSDADKAAYNATLDTGNLDATRLALKGIHSRYVAANGQDPNLISGDTSRDGGVQPFRSQAQIVEAMRDPKYQRDPAYRMQVEDRLKVTDFRW